MNLREQFEIETGIRFNILHGRPNIPYVEWLESEYEKLQSQNNTLAKVCRAKDELIQSRLSVEVTDEMIEEAAEITEVAIIARKAFITGANYVRDRLTQPQSEAIELLERAASLVGNPGTNISGSTDVSCMNWQKDYEQFKQKGE